MTHEELHELITIYDNCRIELIVSTGEMGKLQEAIE